MYKKSYTKKNEFMEEEITIYFNKQFTIIQGAIKFDYRLQK